MCSVDTVRISFLVGTLRDWENVPLADVAREDISGDLISSHTFEHSVQKP